MPLKKKPKFIEGFSEHGVHFISESEEQAHGVCPFCSKDKFFANPATGLWDCKVCIINGNFEKFLTLRMPFYWEHFKGAVVLELSRNRGLKPQSFKPYRIGYDPGTRQYMIPVDGNSRSKGIISNILRYTLGKKAMSTAGASIHMIAPAEVKDTKNVDVEEGIWDAVAKYELTGGDRDIYACMGAGSFPRIAANLFIGKDVSLEFDNDDAGRKGSERAGKILEGFADSTRYLHWPQDLDYPDGFGMRKLYLFMGKGTSEFIRNNLKGVPQTSVRVGTDVVPSEKKIIRLLGASLTPEAVIEKYRKWLHISNPEVLDVLFGSAFANRIPVDPLWVFFVAPPGGSKTELLMSLSDSPKIATTTSLTPQALVSGSNGSGAGDPSLIPKLNGKTLIVKDFTTILNMNQTSRDEIFGILRDAYDGKTEKHFGNGVHRNYTSKFGILAGVTPAIEGFASASSVLGERFIKYKIRQPGSINVGSEVIRQALMNLSHETKMRSDLKVIAAGVLGREVGTELPTITSEVAEQLLIIAQWVASLRGVVSRDRYSQVVNFKPSAEIGTRLAKQLGALAMGIALYRQQKTIDQTIMKLIFQVGKDTAPDRCEEIVKQLYVNQKTGEARDGFTVAELSIWTGFPSNTLTYLLQDLEMLKITSRKYGERVGFWRISPPMVRLMDTIDLYGDELRYAREVRKVGRVPKLLRRVK